MRLNHQCKNRGTKYAAPQKRDKRMKRIIYMNMQIDAALTVYRERRWWKL